MIYPQYEHLVDSKVAWIQQKPRHWRVKRLKFAVDLINCKVNVDSSLLPYIGLEHIESWTGRKIDGEISNSEGLASHFLAGDVLFGKLRPYLAKAHLAQQDGLISSEALVIRCSDEIYAGFLLYYMLSRDFINVVDSSTYGSKMPRASWDFIGNLPVLLPEIDEQKSIARFLDFKTAQIDALITKQQSLLDKLAEKRTALISHAVTKGLDPSVPMKDSGVAWLGNIPHDWKIISVRWLIRIGSGDFISNTDTEFDYSEEAKVPVVGGNGIMAYTRLVNTPNDCIVVGRVGAHCGNVHFIKAPSWVTDNALRVKIISDEVSAAFLICALKAIGLNDYANKNAQPLITGEMVKNKRIALPSLDEQIEICRHIDIIERQISRQTEKALLVIDKLQEYRSALITNVVTGKIDVRSIQIPPSAEQSIDE